MLESINEVDSIVKELEFKTPADFATYKKKHKMRPGTVVRVAGKDKVRMTLCTEEKTMNYNLELIVS